MALAHNECSSLFHSGLNLEVAISGKGWGSSTPMVLPAAPETLSPLQQTPTYTTPQSAQKTGPFNCVQQTGMLQRFESKRGTAR